MEFQHLIDTAIGVALTVFGWFANQLWNAVSELKKDLKKIEVELPTSYVRKEDLENRLDKFEVMLSKIYDKLDTKVDK